MAANERHLLRVLGFRFALAATVGGSIGSGILRTPGPVAAALPNAALILLAWTIGGVLTMIEAMPTIELSCALTDAGGPVVYVERAFGTTVGTMVGWANWLQCVLAVSFMAVVFGEYVHRLGIATLLPTGMLAVALIGVLTAINLGGTRFSGGSQTLGTVIKVGGIMVLIGALFLLAPAAPGSANAALPPATLLGGIVALRLITNTYAGWNAATFLTAEIADPGRNISRSIILGIAIITAMSVAMNAALLHTLPIATIGASTLPVADAVATFAGGRGDAIVTLISLIAVVTIANLTVMYPSRTLYAMAQNGSLPPMFGAVAANGSPTVATLAAAGLTAILASSGAYLALTAVYAPLAAIVGAVVAIAALRLRRTEPGLARPWRMPWHPAPALATIAINLALLIAFLIEDPADSALAMLLLALCLPLLLRVRRTVRPA